MSAEPRRPGAGPARQPVRGASDGRTPATSHEAAVSMPWRLDASRPDHAAALAATPPTPEEVQRRLASIRPTAYAQTRNRLDGAVTGLSPYITHGLLPLAQALIALRQRHHLAWGHTLLREFAWRAYFRHVWRHAGEAIFSSLGPGPLPDELYARELPDDVRRAGTGLAPVDQAVRTLYASGCSRA